MSNHIEHSSHSPGVSDSFKVCSNCTARWLCRNDFLTDANVTLTGYLANFNNPENGHFEFEHQCGAKILLNVSDLSDLYGGPILEGCKTGSEECPGLCLHRNDLSPCPVACECAYVREILQLFACPDEEI